ncbi:conserved protein of unknown function [Xenorhabdus poinarii G6]|uniref:Cyanophage baseplate Pam3 plug gp18 domain-containing protein n=1 Tax=Xenorhabdus poinarii G6 TaxID=1354304 RepID=A0A068R196_9GAMM|nr:hypothetical protein [Xenorhabdus poinarii]CDG21072.1 conserved protein of unknown function [Xenorhabdus poinarii G6]
MREIPLRAIPNQRLAVTLDDANWLITVKTARNMMLCDIQRDDVMVIQGSRLIPNAPLIPYACLGSTGNFAVLTEQDELPWWEHFESTQTLIYWGNDDRSETHPAGD